VIPRPEGRSANEGRRWLRRGLPLAGLVLFLASCAKDAPQDTWQPAGPNAEKIDTLQRPVFYVAGVVLVIVIVAVLYAVFRFRDRGQDIPEQTHGKPALEITLTIIPALILIGIGIPTVATVFDLAKTSDTECLVNVTGQQWWWEYEYPVQDGCGGIEEPIVTANQLVIPSGQKVLLQIQSRDVIHSYWIPKLNGKRDAVPGRVQPLRLEADQPGIYAGQCTEFCGLSHAYMRMEAVALYPQDFETWKTNQLAPYSAPADGTVEKTGEELFVQQCARCHAINGLANGDETPTGTLVADNVVAGAVPNLSHLMSRNTFAGSTFDLLTPACRDEVWNASPEEFGAKYLEGVTPECMNEEALRAWLRDPPAEKPMFADPENLESTDGKYRGMPNLGLTEDQIDALVAYLSTRT
jgi:cytochrome c oxidase subunit 2